MFRLRVRGAGVWLGALAAPLAMLTMDIYVWFTYARPAYEDAFAMSTYDGDVNFEVRCQLHAARCKPQAVR